MKLKNISPEFWLGYLKSTYRLFFIKRSAILIGGCGRTGTSLMSAILGSHPSIVSFNYESYFFSRPHSFKNLTLSRLWRLSKFYLRLVKQGVPPGKSFWCEKTPRNVLNLDRLFLEFGKGLKVILMIRDGYDVLTSRHPKSDGYYISVSRWLQDTQATLKYKNHPQVLIVPYEGVVNHFDFTITKICDFLGVPFSNQMRDFHKNTSVKSHEAFHGGNINAIYKTSLSRWQFPEHKERTHELEEIPEAVSLVVQVQDCIISFLKTEVIANSND
jgi:hypothetical protein